jgi:glycosyl transferase family 87
MGLLGWPQPRQVVWSGVILLLVLLYAGFYLLPLIGAHAPRADDFQDYLFAARQMTTGGDPYADFVRTHIPWDWSLSSGYLYPPLFAAFLIPLTWLPAELAVRVWLLLMQACVIGSLVIIYRVIGRPSRAELIALGAILLTFFPLINSAATGAMNAVLLLLLTAAWACWTRRRDVASGVLVGTAAVFKLFPLALVPYLATRRHWRLLAAVVVTTIAGLALGFAVTSPAHNSYYFRDMLPHLAVGTGYRENQSFAGFTARLCSPSTAQVGGGAGWCGRLLDWPLIVVLLALVLSATARSTRPSLEYALAVTALPLVSSVAWSFHFVVLVLPIALLIRQAVLGDLSRAVGRVLIAGWLCFSVGPAIHYLLIVHALSHWPGMLDLIPGAVTWLAGESYLIGALILFSILWIEIVKERRTASRDAGAAAA